MSKLVLFLVDGTTLDVKLDRDRLTIGRRADNDLCLPYPAVSAEHAAIITILSDSFLEDQGSTNGTLVNGRPVTKHFLRDRDEIDIGRQKLVYVVDESVTLAPAPKPAAASSRDAAGGDVAGAAPFVASTTEAPPRAPGSVVAAPPPVPAARADGVGKPAMPERPAESPLLVRVLTGSHAGRTVPLTKKSTVIGRPGTQVAVIRRTAEGLRVVAVEGEPPRVNGVPAPAGGAPVKVGDTLEVAGASLQIASP
jgi:predicted component of type VI protein secretion system